MDEIVRLARAAATPETVLLLVGLSALCLLTAVAALGLYLRLKVKARSPHWSAEKARTIAIAATREARRSHGALKVTTVGSGQGPSRRPPREGNGQQPRNGPQPADKPRFRLVRLYVDYSNFYQYWKQYGEPGGVRANGAGMAEAGVDWAKLPEALLRALRRLPAFNGQEFVYCGANVYGSYYESEYYDLLASLARGGTKPVLPFGKKPADIDGWRAENKASERDLVEELPQKFGYFVFPYRRRTPILQSAHYSASGVPLAREKGVDVRLCTDLMADAVFDMFDVALVISNDADFVPAVQFVQDELGKTVVQVGFRQHAGMLRETCRHFITLNDRDDIAAGMKRATA